MFKDDQPIEKNVMAPTAILARPYEQIDLARRGRQTAWKYSPISNRHSLEIQSLIKQTAWKNSPR
jgi:hypothetical protein